MLSCTIIIGLSASKRNLTFFELCFKLNSDELEITECMKKPFFQSSISVHRTTNATNKHSVRTSFYLCVIYITKIERIYIGRNVCVVNKVENLIYLTRNITSPHITLTQKSQQQGNCIPYTEITVYFSNLDNFSTIILFKKLTD